MKKLKISKHLVIPDTQVRSGDNLDFLEAIGNFIVEKQPEKIIQIGDFADMPSLSSYDSGKKSFEGRRYRKDILAAQQAMCRLLTPIMKYNKNRRKKYIPRMVLTLGNHEERILRAVDDDAKLEGTIGIEDLEYEVFGWEVHPFLKPVEIDGILYCHYFPRGPNGKVTQSKRGAPSAIAQAHREKMSCTSGHLQGLDTAMVTAGNRKIIRSVIAGSCYEHDESYLTPQGNIHFRGILVKHEVHDGNYDLMEVSLRFLKERYL